MRNRRSRIVLLPVLLLAACTGPKEAVTSSPSEPPRGGTLRLVAPEDPFASLTDPAARPSTLDPQLEYETMAWELLRCCLTRTLLAYPGALASDGGGEPQPDLAAELPEVSDDGLTWTFRLRPGLRYAPPLDDVQIRAADFITAFEREARLGGAGGYSFWYSVVEGFDEYAAGDANAIRGIEAPDDTTLVVRLTDPQGDFGHRLALPAISPIPPHPTDPAAEFGAASGHDDGYGRFLVATGPYMFEGSEDLDLSADADSGDAVAGLDPGRELRLVRNPSWDRASDPVRLAYVDRIEFRTVADLEEAHELIEGDEADLLLYAGPPPQVPEDVFERYRDDPSLGSVEIVPRDFLFSIAINVAVPPFDDLHVRRAMNLVVDKAALIEHTGGHLTGRTATHIGPDGIEANLLSGYDPYAPTDEGPDLERAQEEMALATRYDRDGDGSCDAAACRDVLALELEFPPPLVPIGSLIRRDLARIGIETSPRLLDPGSFFPRMADPREHVALGVSAGWGKDFANASSFFSPLFRSSNIAISNYSLLGASDNQLREWGYSVRGVPNVDARIDQCAALLGDPQTQCWATLDRFLMEEVAPYVPLRVDHHATVIPARIASFSYSQFTTLPALDRIALDV